MPLNNIFERPHFFVKGTFKSYHLIRFYEKYLYETIPSISLIFFKIIQGSMIRYSVDISLSLA